MCVCVYVAGSAGNLRQQNRPPELQHLILSLGVRISHFGVEFHNFGVEFLRFRCRLRSSDGVRVPIGFRSSGLRVRNFGDKSLVPEFPSWVPEFRTRGLVGLACVSGLGFGVLELAVGVLEGSQLWSRGFGFPGSVS